MLHKARWARQKKQKESLATKVNKLPKTKTQKIWDEPNISKNILMAVTSQDPATGGARGRNKTKTFHLKIPCITFCTPNFSELPPELHTK